MFVHQCHTFGIKESFSFSISNGSINDIIPIDQRQFVVATSRDLYRFRDSELVKTAPFSFSTACYMPDIECIMGITVASAKFVALPFYDFQIPVFDGFHANQLSAKYMKYSVKSTCLIVFGEGVKVYQLKIVKPKYKVNSTDISMEISLRSSFANNFEPSLLNVPAFDSEKDLVIVTGSSGVLAYNLDGQCVFTFTRFPVLKGSCFGFCDRNKKFVTADSNEGICIWRKNGGVTRRFNVGSAPLLSCNFVDTENVVTLNSKGTFYILNSHNGKAYISYVCEGPPSLLKCGDYGNPTIYLSTSNTITVLRVTIPWKTWAKNVPSAGFIKRIPRVRCPARILIVAQNSFATLCSPVSGEILTTACSPEAHYPVSILYDRGFLEGESDPVDDKDVLMTVLESGDLIMFDTKTTPCEPINIFGLGARFVLQLKYNNEWCYGIGTSYGEFSILDCETFDRVGHFIFPGKTMRDVKYCPLFHCVVFISEDEIFALDLVSKQINSRIFEKYMGICDIHDDTLYFGDCGGEIKRVFIREEGLKLDIYDNFIHAHKSKITGFGFSKYSWLSCSEEGMICSWDYELNNLSVITFPIPLYACAFLNGRCDVLVSTESEVMLIPNKWIGSPAEPEDKLLDNYDLLKDRLDIEPLPIEGVSDEIVNNQEERIQQDPKEEKKGKSSSKNNKLSQFKARWEAIQEERNMALRMSDDQRHELEQERQSVLHQMNNVLKMSSESMSTLLSGSNSAIHEERGNQIHDPKTTFATQPVSTPNKAAASAKVNSPLSTSRTSDNIKKLNNTSNNSASHTVAASELNSTEDLGSSLQSRDQSSLRKALSPRNNDRTILKQDNVDSNERTELHLNGSSNGEQVVNDRTNDRDDSQFLVNESVIDNERKTNDGIEKSSSSSSSSGKQRRKRHHTVKIEKTDDGTTDSSKVHEKINNSSLYVQSFENNIANESKREVSEVRGDSQSIISHNNAGSRTVYQSSQISLNTKYLDMKGNEVTITDSGLLLDKNGKLICNGKVKVDTNGNIIDERGRIVGRSETCLSNQSSNNSGGNKYSIRVFSVKSSSRRHSSKKMSNSMELKHSKNVNDSFRISQPDSASKLAKLSDMHNDYESLSKYNELNRSDVINNKKSNDHSINSSNNATSIKKNGVTIEKLHKKSRRTSSKHSKSNVSASRQTYNVESELENSTLAAESNQVLDLDTTRESTELKCGDEFSTINGDMISSLRDRNGNLRKLLTEEGLVFIVGGDNKFILEKSNDEFIVYRGEIIKCDKKLVLTIDNGQKYTVISDIWTSEQENQRNTILSKFSLFITRNDGEDIVFNSEKQRVALSVTGDPVFISNDDEIRIDDDKHLVIIFKDGNEVMLSSAHKYITDSEGKITLVGLGQEIISGENGNNAIVNSDAVKLKDDDKRIVITNDGQPIFVGGLQLLVGADGKQYTVHVVCVFTNENDDQVVLTDDDKEIIVCGSTNRNTRIMKPSEAFEAAHLNHSEINTSVDGDDWANIDNNRKGEFQLSGIIRENRKNQVTNSYPHFEDGERDAMSVRESLEMSESNVPKIIDTGRNMEKTLSNQRHFISSRSVLENRSSLSSSTRIRRERSKTPTKRTTLTDHNLHLASIVFDIAELLKQYNEGHEECLDILKFLNIDPAEDSKMNRPVNKVIMSKRELEKQKHLRKLDISPELQTEVGIKSTWRSVSDITQKVSNIVGIRQYNKRSASMLNSPLHAGRSSVEQFYIPDSSDQLDYLQGYSQYLVSPSLPVIQAPTGKRIVTKPGGTPSKSTSVSPQDSFELPVESKSEHDTDISTATHKKTRSNQVSHSHIVYAKDNELLFRSQSPQNSLKSHTIGNSLRSGTKSSNSLMERSKSPDLRAKSSHTTQADSSSYNRVDKSKSRPFTSTLKGSSGDLSFNINKSVNVQNLYVPKRPSPQNRVHRKIPLPQTPPSLKSFIVE